MTNPTLIGQDSPWRGWTWTQLHERLLASRGLTLDTSTGRTPATTDEQTASSDCLKRAIATLASRYPSFATIRTWTTTWVSGDHSVALPTNVLAPLSVTLGGYPLAPMTGRDDYYRQLRPDEEGGDIADEGRPGYYRHTGYATDGSTGFKQVIQLHPTPGDDYAGATLVVEYLAVGLDVSTAANLLPINPSMQGWVLERAKEFWAAESNDLASMQVAEGQRKELEEDIGRWMEGSRVGGSRLRWRYPKPARGTRYQYP